MGVRSEKIVRKMQSMCFHSVGHTGTIATQALTAQKKNFGQSSYLTSIQIHCSWTALQMLRICRCSTDCAPTNVEVEEVPDSFGDEPCCADATERFLALLKKADQRISRNDLCPVVALSELFISFFGIGTFRSLLACRGPGSFLCGLR